MEIEIEKGLEKKEQKKIRKEKRGEPATSWDYRNGLTTTTIVGGDGAYFKVGLTTTVLEKEDYDCFGERRLQRVWEPFPGDALWWKSLSRGMKIQARSNFLNKENYLANRLGWSNLASEKGKDQIYYIFVEFGYEVFKQLS